MAIYRTSDSLSRCNPEVYSHLYDVTKKASLKSDSIGSSTLIAKDTLELSGQKLKKEALNRLSQPSKFLILQTGFIRIGKYLFVGLAFPPYLLLIGLPKWVISTFALPLIQWIAQSSVRFKEKIKKPLLNFLQKTLNKIQQSRLFIQQLIRPFIHSFYALNKELKDLLKKIKTPLKGLKGIFSRNLKFLSQQINFARKKLKTYQEKIQLRLTFLANELKNVSQRLALSLRPLFQQIIERGAKQFKINKEHAFKQAEQKITVLNQVLKKGLKNIELPFLNIKQQIKDKVTLLWQVFSEKLKGQGQQAKEFSQKQKKRAKAFFEVKQKKLKNLSFFSIKDSLIASSWIKKYPLIFQYWLKKVVTHGFVAVAGNLLIQGYVLSMIKLLKGMDFLTDQLFSLSSLVALHSIKTMKNLVISYQKLNELATEIKQKLKKFAFHCFYHFSVGLFMIGILAVRGFYLMLEWSKEIENKITRN